MAYHILMTCRSINHSRIDYFKSTNPMLRNTLLTTFCLHSDSMFFAFHPTTQSSTQLRWYSHKLKQWVASRNVTFKTEDVKLLCKQKFDEMREREWCPMCVVMWKNRKTVLRNRENYRLRCAMGAMPVILLIGDDVIQEMRITLGIALCSLIGVDRRVRGTYCPHHQDNESSPPNPWCTNMRDGYILLYYSSSRINLSLPETWELTGLWL
jgi:hypothetical protein